jgi:hypothetical protein
VLSSLTSRPLCGKSPPRRLANLGGVPIRNCATNWEFLARFAAQFRDVVKPFLRVHPGWRRFGEIMAITDGSSTIPPEKRPVVTTYIADRKLPNLGEPNVERILTMTWSTQCAQPLWLTPFTFTNCRLRCILLHRVHCWNVRMLFRYTCDQILQFRPKISLRLP